MNNIIFKKILINVIIGSLLIGLVSYFTFMYDEHPEYLNITAFLWGVPLIYFYLLYITYQKHPKAMESLTKHGTIGVVLTLTIMIATLYMFHNKTDIDIILGINIIYSLLVIFLYFYYRVYNRV